jgi:hypothetical protein
MLFSGNFAHRHNQHGSYDSICTTCLMTVASVENEWQLAEHEATHTCDPEMRFSMDRARERAEDATVVVSPVLDMHSSQA